MITVRDLNPHNYDTTPEQDARLLDLAEKLNMVQIAYGKPMSVTSGLRSLEDQMRINPKAPKSKHLLGAAADIADVDGDLKKFVLANLDLIAKIGLYMEDFASTPTWVHFQIISPASGRRIFKP